MNNAWMRAALAGGFAFATMAHPLAAPPAGIAELRFAQVFRLPVGPRGLELTREFLALDGQLVRIVGYQVRSAAGDRDGFIIAPFPVSIGDDDESFSDDLPASALYVRLVDGDADDFARMPGPLSVTGELHVGATRMADGRLLPARIDAKRLQPTSVTP